MKSQPTDDWNEEDRELFEHFRIEVDPGQGQERIDKFLAQKIQNASRSKIQHAAEAGCIRVNGTPVKSNYRIKPLDTIVILLPYAPRDTEVLPENIPLNIVYEDQDVLVVNKPAGMVVHPGHGNYTGTLVNALVYYFNNLPVGQGENRPGLVHRIDKNTSGLLLISKTELAQMILARQFFEHRVDRLYHALIWGNPESDSGTISGNLGRSLRDRKVMQVFQDTEKGKEAVTHYKVLERFGYVTLVECRLETGRTHQIRAHFQHIGHPLFGDPEYGGNRIVKGTSFSKYKQFVENCFSILPRQALHAKTLGFIHPTTGKHCFFDSFLPDDMQLVIDKWRRYISGTLQEISE